MSAIVQLCGTNQGAKMEIPIVAPEECLLTITVPMGVLPMGNGRVAIKVLVEVTDDDMRALQALAKEAA